MEAKTTGIDQPGDRTQEALSPTGFEGVDPAVNPAELGPPEPTVVSSPTGIRFGYARVSTRDQNLDRQTDALRAAGVLDKHIFIDRLSGGMKVSERPAQTEMMRHLRAGDSVVIMSLDRAGRRAADLLTWIDEIHEAGASLIITDLGVDSRSPVGKLIIGVLASLAEVERDLIRARVRSGLEAARRQGRVGGRPPALTEEQKDAALSLVASGKTPKQVAIVMGCSDRTIRRLIAEHRSDA